MAVPDIPTIIQIAVVAAALFGTALGLAWHFGTIEVCWLPELRDLKTRCRSLAAANESLVKENAGLRREVDHLKRLATIDEAAQRTTRAMLEVAVEEQRRLQLGRGSE